MVDKFAQWEQETMEERVNVVGQELSSLVCDMSPICVLNLSKARANCVRMRERAARGGTTLRFHTKTHKTLEGLQLQAGTSDLSTVKIVTSTLAEVNYFRRQGAVKDILYGVPLNPDLIPRLKRDKLLYNTHFMIDQLATLKALVDSADQNMGSISIYIAIDTGYGREGITIRNEEGQETLRQLADTLVAKGEMIHVRGLYAHAGHSYDATSQCEVCEIAKTELEGLHLARQLLGKHGLRVKVLSVGATPTASQNDAYAVVPTSSDYDNVDDDVEIEVHPGNYIFYDRQQCRVGSCGIDDVALSVWTTVLAHYPNRNSILINAGGLALSRDSAGFQDWGHLPGAPEMQLVKISQEVGVLQPLDAGSAIDWDKYPIGSVLQILPNHSCYVAPLHHLIYVYEEPSEHDNDGQEQEQPKVQSVWKPCWGW
jgi:D-serine deaminase-like pyridoxal phosphate-dependent protein